MEYYKSYQIWIFLQKQRYFFVFRNVLYMRDKKEKARIINDVAIAASDVLRPKWDNASSAMHYLRKEMGGEKFEEAYGAYGKFSYFSQGADLPDVAAVDVYDLKAPVPLDGYTLLLPEFCWAIRNLRLK